MTVAWAQVVTLEVMRNRILDIVEGGAKGFAAGMDVA